MKVAIVTGASSGMGYEAVRQLPFFYTSLEEIWVIARRKEKLDSLPENSSVSYRIFQGDLTKNDVYEALQMALKEQQPDVRMLINGAGFGKTGDVEAILKKEPVSQTEMIDLNCRALTRMTLLVLPYLSAGSRILNLASAAAFCPQPSFAVYAASKAYALSFSRALGMEVRKRGICVTAVCPGPVNTEFFSVSGKLPNPWKDAVMADPVQVVRQALKDSRKRKEVSVYGTAMKLSRLGAKLIPHSMIMKFLYRRQK